VERGFELVIDADLVVPGRGEELTRLFRNLLENALNYSPAGTAISVGVDRLGREVVIAVENEGSPITQELAETIFLPFQRGSSSGSGGFGLGLGIARAIARAHDGELVVDTRAARPRFVVTLPVSLP
jgi:signal transduction histidine kinase